MIESFQTTQGHTGDLQNRSRLLVRTSSVRTSTVRPLLGPGLLVKKALLLAPDTAQSLLRVLIEALLFSTLFIVTGVISLSVSLQDMVGPMIAVVCMMIACMIVSGVYHQDTADSILTVYKRSIVGFGLSVVGLFGLLTILPDVFSTGRFVFFFLFFQFFVINTVRPLLYGTDFVGGGGRRRN